MRNFTTLFQHELRMLLISPATYLAAFFFYVVMGLLYWSILRDMIATAQDELPAVYFFKLFWLPTVFVVPLLTMRSVAGQRSDGTLDALFTTATTYSGIILSKFAGAYLFYLLLWVGTLCFPAITLLFFPHVAPLEALLERAAVTGSLLFIALSGFLFIAIGIFSSCLTRSQLVAGMLTFTALFAAIVGGSQIEGLTQYSADMNSWLQPLAGYLQVFQHLDDFSRGIIDTRPFFYYISTGSLVLGLATLVIEAKS
jgi:ABC-2 type transport system permease protein